MSQAEDWITDKLSKLLIIEERITTLSEIKDHFSSLNANEAKDTANRIQLPIVFDCLNDTDEKQVDLACEVLSVCMKNLTIQETTKRYYPYLTRALNHPKPEVKCMALEQLERFTVNSEEQLVICLCNELDLLHAVINAIGDNDLAVAKIACRIVTQLGITPPGIRRLVKSPTLEICQGILNMNEVVRFRFYEVMLDISRKYEDALEAFMAHGLLPKLIQEVNSKDVLIKMNVLELLIPMATCTHGYEFLEKQGIFKFFDILAAEDADPLESQLLEPALLKFFGNVAHAKPLKIFSEFPDTVKKLFSNIGSDDLTVFTVTVDTIGHIGSKKEGKLALESQGNRFKDVITFLSSKIPFSPTEQKVTILNCLETLIKVQDPDNKISQITEKWFGYIGQNPITIVQKYWENPFFEIRFAGFGILRSIAGQSWGHQLIKDTPGLVEFLLDRSVEHIKECKEVKYEIVSLLSRSSIFDNTMQARLQRYVKEGIFYQQGVLEVAVEGND